MHKEGDKVTLVFFDLTEKKGTVLLETNGHITINVHNGGSMRVRKDGLKAIRDGYEV